MSLTPIPIGIADDHKFYRQGLLNAINMIGGYTVIIEAENGLQLLTQFKSHELPHIVLLDLNMPIMSGLETFQQIRKNYPTIKVLAISGYSDYITVLEMKKLGVDGFVSKNADQHEFASALTTLSTNQEYFNENVSSNFHSSQQPQYSKNLKSHDLQFLNLMCTGDSYAEIGAKMFLSIHTIHGYRDKMFERFNVQNRATLMVKLFKLKIVDINSLSV